MNNNSKIYVADHRGLVGSAIVKNPQDKSLIKVEDEELQKELNAMKDTKGKADTQEKIMENIFETKAFSNHSANLIDESKDSSEDGKALMKYQSENGFSKNILAQESEDIWSDV